jgi:hypothetical protein
MTLVNLSRAPIAAKNRGEIFSSPRFCFQPRVIANEWASGDERQKSLLRRTFSKIVE